MTSWLRNSLFALVMLAVLLVLLSWRQTTNKPTRQLQVRQVEIAKLAPPPSPPETVQQKQKSLIPKLTVVSSDQTTAPELAMSTLAVDLPEVSDPTLNYQKVEQELPDFDASTDQLLSVLETFGLDQLDELPRMLSPLDIALPRSLVRKGLNSVELKLHIIIHETGRVELLANKTQQYPELDDLAAKVAKRSRFTAPRRKGEKVKAEFILPVRIDK